MDVGLLWVTQGLVVSVQYEEFFVLCVWFRATCFGPSGAKALPRRAATKPWDVRCTDGLAIEVLNRSAKLQQHPLASPSIPDSRP